MFIRYMLEAFLFVVLAASIQISISSFYTDLNTIRKHMDEKEVIEQQFPDSYENKQEWQYLS
jgi:hypothetical protein